MNNRDSIVTKEQLTEWVSQLDLDGALLNKSDFG